MGHKPARFNMPAFDPVSINYIIMIYWQEWTMVEQHTHTHTNNNDTISHFVLLESAPW